MLYLHILGSEMLHRLVFCNVSAGLIYIEILKTTCIFRSYSVPGIKNILQKCTNSGNFVVNVCAETFSAVNTCMVLLKHRRYFGCEVVSNYLTESMPLLMLGYASRVLRKETDRDCDEEGRFSTNVYVKVVEAIEVQKLLDR